MARSEDLIDAGEADRALATLLRFAHVVLAVSGGPDSLALLYMVAEWKKRTGLSKPSISVATVDHGLRPESVHEAQFVARHAEKLGLAHSTLCWEGAKPVKGIANAARNARYELLHASALGFCGDGDVAVATAHHQDDQAETVFMRLSRGGGVDALAGMPAERALRQGSPVRLVRPLLDFSKSQLMATLNTRGVDWIEDPTNANCMYERVRVRTALAASGLEAASLAMTARRMHEAREGLSYAKARFQNTLALSYNGGVFASFQRRPFDDGPLVLRQMILDELICQFGGKTGRPEMSEIETLAARIGNTGEVTTATLGGAVISAGKRVVRLWREFGRIADADLNLTSGKPVLWDNRFWVSFEGDAGAGLSVRPLGLDAYRSISGQIGNEPAVPMAAALGLPAFWANATLLAVPQLALTKVSGGHTGGLILMSEPAFCDAVPA